MNVNNTTLHVLCHSRKEDIKINMSLTFLPRNKASLPVRYAEALYKESVMFRFIDGLSRLTKGSIRSDVNTKGLTQMALDIGLTDTEDINHNIIEARVFLSLIR